MRPGRYFAAGALALSVVATAACNDSSYGTNPQLCQPTGTQVCMGATSFNPANRTVSAGSTVQWIDGSGVQHTVTSAPGSAETFDQTVTPAGAFSRQFNTPGTYDYYCKIHGSPTSGMRGTITVN